MGDISDFAQRRMDRLGLTDSDIRYVIEHCDDLHDDEPYIGHQARLPDG